MALTVQTLMKKADVSQGAGRLSQVTHDWRRPGSGWNSRRRRRPSGSSLL